MTYTLNVGDWVGPKTDVGGCGRSRAPPGFNSRTVQLVASRYIDYTIPFPI